ncbi:MAG TPA: hypothetical protein VJP80_02060 [Candidatus Saccharimonadales bacterium]|nr:hypothetical protein [Candidatus Saccharimonadales bacterium]
MKQLFTTKNDLNGRIHTFLYKKFAQFPELWNETGAPYRGR